MKKMLKKGFTLIELLVVITIIGILATGGVTVYTGQMKKARDSVRISDIKKLQTGFESFYQDISEYPIAAKFAANANGLDVLDYVPSLPQDSRNNTAGCVGTGAVMCGYIYAVGQVLTARDQFELSVAFENPGTREQEAMNDNANDATRLEVLSGNGTGWLDTARNSTTAFAYGAAPTTMPATFIITGSGVFSR